MAIKSISLTVGATSTPLVVAPANGTWEGATVWVEIYNPGTSTVYLGGATVDTTNGRPVVTGASWSFPLSHGDGLYGIVASGTQVVTVFRGRA